MIQMQSFLGNGDQDVGGYGNPDLRLHRVLAGAQKAFDAQMLLDPFEEQLHLPAALVQRGDSQRRQARIVGQEHQRLAGLRIVEADAVVKGQTASSSYKPAMTTNGLRIMVPAHIGAGTRIVINTDDDSYVERAKD
jgi:hypothetical protein